MNDGNLFYREVAQRLLAERMDDGLANQLQSVVLDETQPRRQRLHALWSIAGGRMTPDGLLLALLNHADPTLRAWAVRMAGNQGEVASDVAAKIASLSGDPSPDVQLQVAIAARKIALLEPLLVLVNVLASCGEDTLIPHIVWQNLHPLLEQPNLAAQFIRELKQHDLSKSPGLRQVASRAAEKMLEGAGR